MALTVYLGCKFLAWIFVRASGASAQRHFGYLGAWPGMDAAAFFEDHPMSANPRPLMDWPRLSVSLNEFWGRRWHTAFRGLTYRFWFRPMAARVGPRASMMIGFVLSGLIHDVVISVPANGGYGMPTLFFLFPALGVLFERACFARRLGLMRGWRGWSFTSFWLINPISMLFHRHFIDQRGVSIMLPFLRESVNLVCSSHQRSYRSD